MQLPALYELSAEYREAAQQLAELDLDEQTLNDALEGLRFPLEQKAQNVALVAANLDALAESAKAAADVLAAKAKRASARADALRAYLLHHMQASGITRIEPTKDRPYFCLSIRNNPESVEIVDPAAIPREYKTDPKPPEPAPDKRLILKALKDGHDVPGCRIKQTQRLEVK